MVTELTDDTFDEIVAAENTPAVIDFYADWCGPCKAIAPIVEDLAETTESVRFFKVDVDANPGLLKRFEVRSMPTLVRLDEDGIETKRQIGAVPKEKLQAFALGS